MRRTFSSIITVMIIGLFLTPILMAQNDNGGITKSMLEKIQSKFKMSKSSPAILNAVTSNDIRKLALNRENLGRIDTYFAHKIEVKGITNQKSSGRCWLFTGLNVLRSKVIKKYNLKKFEFSQDYCFFWDQLEKANLFLEGIIETRDLKMKDRKVEWLFRHPISDGGVWNMVVDMVEKYGLVPSEAMPESYNSNNTRTMNRLLQRKLREDGLILRRMYREKRNLYDLRRAKSKMLAEIYRMLVINLGEPPKEFTWRYEDKDGKLSKPRKFTPVGFYHEVLDIDLHDYVMLMNDPTREYYKLYEIEYDRDMYDKPNWTFVNLPTEKLKEFARRSILNDESMYFSCDVGKQLNRQDGILSVKNYDYESIYGIKFGMDKKDRILTFDSGSSHGMALVGVDTSANGVPTKWLLENSWGKSAGYNGYLVMTDKWFDEYMFRLVVRKKFVSPDVLAVLRQKPIMLKPWDPMFLPFEDD